MFKHKHKIKPTLLSIPLVMAILLLTGGLNYSFAQDFEDEDMRTAVVQYTLKYRFSPDLKTGDMVKYELEEDESEEPEILELKVTGEEKDNLWIEEHFKRNEVHYLIDPDQMELLKVKGTDEDGNTYELDPLDKAKFSDKMGMINMMMDKQGARQQIKSWKKSDRQETADCPAGSFDCELLVPVYSDLYNSQVEEYRSAMKQSGRSDDEIAAEITRNEPKLLFSGKVPRMIPIAMAMGWMPYIEAFEEVEGGLVVSRPMFSVRLVEYNK